MVVLIISFFSFLMPELMAQATDYWSPASVHQRLQQERSYSPNEAFDELKKHGMGVELDRIGNNFIKRQRFIEKYGVYIEESDNSPKNFPCIDCPKITSLVKNVNEAVRKIATEKKEDVNYDLLNEVDILEALYFIAISEDKDGEIKCDQGKIGYDLERMGQPYSEDDLVYVFDTPIETQKINAMIVRGTKQKSYYLRGRGNQNDIVVRVDVFDRDRAKITYYRVKERMAKKEIQVVSREVAQQLSEIEVKLKRTDLTEEEKIALKKEIVQLKKDAAIKEKKNHPRVVGAWYGHREEEKDDVLDVEYGLLLDAKRFNRTKVTFVELFSKSTSESTVGEITSTLSTRGFELTSRNKEHSGQYEYGAKLMASPSRMRAEFDLVTNKNVGANTLYLEKAQTSEAKTLVGVTIPSRIVLSEESGLLLQGQTSVDQQKMSGTYVIPSTNLGSVTYNRYYSENRTEIINTHQIDRSSSISVKIDRKPSSLERNGMTNGLWLNYRLNFK